MYEIGNVDRHDFVWKSHTRKPGDMGSKLGLGEEQHKL